MRLDRADGSPFTSLVSFACHATALGHGEQHAATDYVGPMRRALEETGTGPVLYLNGCGGDVNPASMDNRGRAAADALGRGLAEVAKPLWRDAAPVGDGSATVDAAQEWVVLPYLTPRSAGEAAALLATGRERLAATQVGTPEYRLVRVVEVDYAQRLLRLHYGNETLPNVRAEVQALRIGPIAILGLPGEIYSSIGRAIKDASPVTAPRTLVAGWTNDSVGYVPDRSAYGVASYEADTAARWYGHPAPWAPEAGNLLCDAALRALNRVAAR